MAGYDMYFGDMVFPVAPEEIKIKINGNNKTYELINEGELNVLKIAKLSTVEFEALLPAIPYPFATYPNGFKTPGWFLNRLEELKQSRKPFQFIISRHNSKGVLNNLYNTNMTVSIEDYAIKEDAKQNGFDTVVEIILKQFKQFNTKTFEVEVPAPTAPIAITPVRPKSTVKLAAPETPSLSASSSSGGGGGGGSSGGNKTPTWVSNVNKTIGNAVKGAFSTLNTVATVLSAVQSATKKSSVDAVTGAAPSAMKYKN